MLISDMLDLRAVVAEIQSTGKRDALEELAAAVALAHPDLGKDRVLGTLLDREKLGSTGVGEGIAIPHGKIGGLPGLVVGFGRSRQGISFDAIDGKPVHLFFLLLAPEDSPGTHLKALARISRLLKDQGFRDRLLGAAGAAEILDVIRREDGAAG